MVTNGTLSGTVLGQTPGWVWIELTDKAILVIQDVVFKERWSKWDPKDSVKVRVRNANGMVDAEQSVPVSDCGRVNYSYVFPNKPGRYTETITFEVNV